MFGSIRFGSLLPVIGDSDGDGIIDIADDCRNGPNPRQTDSDADGVGDP